MEMDSWKARVLCFLLAYPRTPDAVLTLVRFLLCVVGLQIQAVVK